MCEFESRVVLITGGTRGIGWAIADNFINNRAIVIINYAFDEENANAKLRECRGRGKVNAVKGNIAKESDVIKLVDNCIENYGRIDILVNNAGIQGNFVSNLNYSINEWLHVLNTNLTSSFLCCKHVIPYMVRQNYGRIINISSIAATDGYPTCAAYSASKAGMVGLTKSLAKELSDHDITVNAILPGITNTRMSSVLSQEKIHQILAKIPKGRMADPSEIANLALFLSSDKAKYITGECHKITGGR